MAVYADVGDTEDWLRAGKIGQDALLYGKELLQVGASARDVLQSVERFIRERGAMPAFPAQVSRNEIAAHFCPTKADNPVFAKDDVVTMDVGVHVNGAIADNAVTVDLSDDARHKEHIQASRQACLKASRMVKDGMQVCEVGQVIEETIMSFGFNPVRNLSGHGLARYRIHTSPSIPNYNNGDRYALQAGQMIAIEPFATAGKSGLIRSKGEATVFELHHRPRVRSRSARSVLNRVGTLPFTIHWFEDMHPSFFSMALKELSPLKHPPLVDVDGANVTQHEHSMLIGDEKSQITTWIDGRSPE